ncbi:hypothetical protein [Pseudarthrobacter sp. NamB4]|uniref:hypothetical protein n=1 Tax=Pseudarthrobacter sp. NamB4 TaxID=2576837 RepID=UPI0010FEF3BE|nr:hypothetical protein [Pseudarthrobacter sp. NamB4]TLM74186.1 hypothetical protein FDW81_06655 [Pseudarthrobacter sp. NamB4]
MRKADGTFATELSQRGTVESVSGTAITVRSEDGYSQTYGVNAETQSAAPDGGERLGHSRRHHRGHRRRRCSADPGGESGGPADR